MSRLAMTANAVSVNTEIHQSPPKYAEIHHTASIYLPKYTSIVMVQVAVKFGYALFLINIGHWRN